MKDFKCHTIGTTEVIMRVGSLLRDHPELINGFNHFLPLGYEVHVEANEQDDNVKVLVRIPSPSPYETPQVEDSQNIASSSNASQSSPPGTEHVEISSCTSDTTSEDEDSQIVDLTPPLASLNSQEATLSDNVPSPMLHKSSEVEHPEVIDVGSFANTS